jgi:hypothetical protein
MRCSAFHLSDCIAVNARCGHVVARRLRRHGVIYPEARAVEECYAKPTVTKWDNSGSRTAVIWR